MALSLLPVWAVNNNHVRKKINKKQKRFTRRKKKLREKCHVNLISNMVFSILLFLLFSAQITKMEWVADKHSMFNWNCVCVQLVKGQVVTIPVVVVAFVFAACKKWTIKTGGGAIYWAVRIVLIVHIVSMHVLHKLLLLINYRGKINTENRSLYNWLHQSKVTKWTVLIKNTKTVWQQTKTGKIVDFCCFLPFRLSTFFFLPACFDLFQSFSIFFHFLFLPRIREQVEQKSENKIRNNCCKTSI